MRWRAMIGGLCLSALLCGCEQTAPLVRAPATAQGDSVRLVPLRNARLVYPPEAEKAGIQGRVTLDCAVDTEGATENCRVVHGADPSLDAAALSFVRASRFQPVLRDGVPTRIEHYAFAINFAIRPRGIRQQFVFECAVDQAGRVGVCTPPAAIPAPVTQMVQGLDKLLTGLPASPSVRNGETVTDPHRRVTALLLGGFPAKATMTTIALLSCETLPQGAGALATADCTNVETISRAPTSGRPLALAVFVTGLKLPVQETGDFSAP